MPRRVQPFSFRQYFGTARTRVAGAIVGVVVVAGVMVLMMSRPTSPPNLYEDDVSRLASFVTDRDFNRLPARERLDYLLDFLDVFRDFDQERAAELAAFVANMRRSMRDQVEVNMRVLAVDLMGESADEYQEVTPEDRIAFVEALLLDMDRIGQRLEGRERNETDAQRLERLRRQAQRDQERARANIPAQPQAERVTGFFEFYNKNSEEMGAVQRGQTARLIRDMTRHLRGESIGP